MKVEGEWWRGEERGVGGWALVMICVVDDGRDHEDVCAHVVGRGRCERARQCRVMEYAMS